MTSRSLPGPSATPVISRRGGRASASSRRWYRPRSTSPRGSTRPSCWPRSRATSRRLCRCHTCEIMEYLPDTQAVRVLAEYDARGRRWATSGVFDLREFPATRRVLDDQAAMTVNVDDRGADAAEVALMRRYGEKSVLMLPLVFGGDTIGLLEACDRERSRRYSAQELRLCRALAGQAAVALHHARLFGARSSRRDRAGVAARRFAQTRRAARRRRGLGGIAERGADTLRGCARRVRGALLRHLPRGPRPGRRRRADRERPRRAARPRLPASWATVAAVSKSRSSPTSRQGPVRPSCSSSSPRSPPG